eukprot:5527664-Amphidinium_carterae.1
MLVMCCCRLPSDDLGGLLVVVSYGTLFRLYTGNVNYVRRCLQESASPKEFVETWFLLNQDGTK